MLHSDWLRYSLSIRRQIASSEQPSPLMFTCRLNMLTITNKLLKSVLKCSLQSVFLLKQLDYSLSISEVIVDSGFALVNYHLNFANDLIVKYGQSTSIRVRIPW